MTSKRLEKEERYQAEPVRNEEDLDAIRENNAPQNGLNGVARQNEPVETAEYDDLTDEEEEQAEDAMTGGA